ncbi:EsV-1-179 [Ectocarpus siliculosus]|uniref:EsV-1-179 n=1 Tax=Ectocarpus siliculosus TaxID=2880 RepID=D8LPJ8_ECTSI|nr:EsV-1-179 [Ectocarpus siliculosus]|eukprot:CBN80470.1 EsV-1-179 [Ectocarpus siliculosus]
MYKFLYHDDMRNVYEKQYPFPLVTHGTRSRWLSMAFHKPCKFPITRYEGEYRPTWTRRWTTIGGKNGSWQFFSHARAILPDNNGESYTWEGEYGWFNLMRPMLAGPSNDWGAFDLAGLLQINQSGELIKACGCVSLKANDLRYFIRAGITVGAHCIDRGIDNLCMTPAVFCIPGTGGKFDLTLVTTNKTIGKTLVEVYFLCGRETAEVRSRLPGMHKFYRRARLKKCFANFVNLFGGACGD